MACLLFACHRETSPAPSAFQAETQVHAAAPDEVARCGKESVTRAAVYEVSIRKKITRDQATLLLVGDACFSAAATRRGLSRSPLVAATLRAQFARGLLSALHGSTQGDPTADEIRRFRDQHWREVDRPEGVHVVHTVFLSTEGDKEEAERRSRSEAVTAANQLFSQVHAVHSEEEFRRVVQQQVGENDPGVRTEDLPPFAPDGRGFSTEATSMDPTFAAAAHGLETSRRVGRVDTKFGAHVLFLVARLPAQYVDLPTIKTMAAEEAHAERTRLRFVALLRELRSNVSVSVERNVEEKTLLFRAHTAALP